MQNACVSRAMRMYTRNLNPSDSIKKNKKNLQRAHKKMIQRCLPVFFYSGP